MEESIFKTISYKIENNKIVNICVVDPEDPVEEGFIKRESYSLKIGFEGKFGDFYPEWYTQENYENDLQRFQRDIDNARTNSENSIKEISVQIEELNKTPEAERTEDFQQTVDFLTSEVGLHNKYIAYLDNFIIENPYMQSLPMVGGV